MRSDAMKGDEGVQSLTIRAEILGMHTMCPLPGGRNRALPVMPGDWPTAQGPLPTRSGPEVGQPVGSFLGFAGFGPPRRVLASAIRVTGVAGSRSLALADHHQCDRRQFLLRRLDQVRGEGAMICPPTTSSCRQSSGAELKAESPSA